MLEKIFCHASFSLLLYYSTSRTCELSLQSFCSKSVLYFTSHVLHSLIGKSQFRGIGIRDEAVKSKGHGV